LNVKTKEYSHSSGGLHNQTMDVIEAASAAFVCSCKNHKATTTVTTI